MALADGRDYLRFLYVRLTALRGRQFRQALLAAAAEGRLPAKVAILTDEGVRLREPALAPRGHRIAPFEIDFAQMPRLAALIDFLHNALAFSAVADLLAPLVRPGAPARSADEVARSLHAALNSWLSDRLESANHLRQAQRIRAFLASRGSVAPEAIDDEGILTFWTTIASAAGDERIDGFRLYRSAASALMRYRQALRDAAAARHLEDSLGRGFETARGEPSIDDAGGSGIEPWRSPLASLPASPVKWLTRKELHLLLNYLGAPADEEAGESGDDEETGHREGGLAGDERFDLAFRLTLLRADVFGAAQASIVARLRKRAAAAPAIAQAIDAVDDAAYATCTAAYADLRGQLRIECLAALSLLMEHGAPEAAILLNHLGGPRSVRAVIGSLAGGAVSSDDEEVAGPVREEIAAALRAACANPGSVPDDAARELVLEARAAARKVSRTGFRREDRDDPAMLAALAAGASAIVALVDELGRLTAALSAGMTPGDVPADRARFVEAFRRIYLPANDG